MINQNSFRKVLKTIVPLQLEPLGYSFIGVSEDFGGGLWFFQKHFWDDIFGFVSFQLLRAHIALPGTESSSQGFRVALWRNKGPQPHRGHSKDDFYMKWLYMPLGQLLWMVLDVKTYDWQYHKWGFSTEEGLSNQLQDSLEKLTQYDIPWLENPESENPYTSWP